jgi:hypothetical protein
MAAVPHTHARCSTRAASSGQQAAGRQQQAAGGRQHRGWQAAGGWQGGSLPVGLLRAWVRVLIRQQQQRHAAGSILLVWISTSSTSLSPPVIRHRRQQQAAGTGSSNRQQQQAAGSSGLGFQFDIIGATCACLGLQHMTCQGGLVALAALFYAEKAEYCACLLTRGLTAALVCGCWLLDRLDLARKQECRDM